MVCINRYCIDENKNTAKVNTIRMIVLKRCVNIEHVLHVNDAIGNNTCL